MGTIYAEIELINGNDLSLARRKIIGQEKVRRLQVNARVDTGSYMLCINEHIQECLQLPLFDKKKVKLKDGSVTMCDIIAPIEVAFKNRRSTTRALILPGNTTPIMGTMLLMDMDVIIHPLRQELIVNPDHPYFAQMKLK